MIKGPNIFDFATSELSQDAFLCWLAQWADPSYANDSSELHNLGKEFLSACFCKHKVEPPKVIRGVRIQKQVENIDVLIVINDEHVILIEDKVHTKEHHNQLITYLESDQAKKYSNCHPIYYKTINQSNLDNVMAAGYKVIDRQDMLNILEKGLIAGIKDSIFLSYYFYLKGIQYKVDGYKDGTEWDGYYSWMGFFSEVQRLLKEWSRWDYVPNPRGGFLGLWWFFHGDEDCKQYIQLERNLLCFKIIVPNKDKRSEQREFWCRTIIKVASQLGFDVQKPSRFGNGTVMTVAVWGKDYRIFSAGKIDMGETLKVLNTAELILKSAITAST